MQTFGGLENRTVRLLGFADFPVAWKVMTRVGSGSVDVLAFVRGDGV